MAPGTWHGCAHGCADGAEHHRREGSTPAGTWLWHRTRLFVIEDGVEITAERLAVFTFVRVGGLGSAGRGVVVRIE